MVLSRIKHFLEDVLDKVVDLFMAIALFILFAVFLLVSAFPVVIPIVAGYAVFAVTSSPIDPLVKVIVFALYSAGLFLYGGVVGFSGCKDVKEELKTGLDMCEKKVLSVMDDVNRCWSDRRHSRRCRSSVESKIYDFMMCMEAVKRKL
jgi:hypothetical protein